MSNQPVAHGEPVYFEIEGVRFKLNALKPIPALKISHQLKSAILPLINDFTRMVDLSDLSNVKLKFNDDTPVIDLIKRALEVTELLPDLYSAYVGSCEVVVLNTAMSIEASNVFARRNGLLIAWIIKCTEIQFGDFLDGNGLITIWSQVKTLFGSTFQVGSAGKSGT
jgi:hypothetical protein